MAINYKKSCCLRIGPRCDVSCANIISSTGQVLPWTNVIRYLRIFIVQSRTFKCSVQIGLKRSVPYTELLMLCSAKQADWSSCTSSLKDQIISVFLYGLEALPLNKSHISSIDFVTNRLFMTLFNTNNIEIVKCCQQEFCFSLPSITLAHRHDVE